MLDDVHSHETPITTNKATIFNWRKAAAEPSVCRCLGGIQASATKNGAVHKPYHWMVMLTDSYAAQFLLKN